MKRDKQNRSYQTRQKKAVRDVLNQSQSPLTPQQILLRASEQCPRIGMATVYRCLRNLMEDGAVRVVDIPGAPPHYEIEKNVHHHFFLCEVCNHVFNLEGCVSGIDSMLPEGFDLRRHEITLYGVCSTCKNKLHTSQTTAQPQPQEEHNSAPSTNSIETPAFNPTQTV
ncbi:MAG: transcriptional repressor [Chthoniobacterales bacterium]|nr:transcriptional repressor [Chthoniobacterales bacterium]MCX7712389.1 transcriptional repressor [Chthoniobacterales bacterium]